MANKVCDHSCGYQKVVCSDQKAIGYLQAHYQKCFLQEFAIINEIAVMMQFCHGDVTVDRDAMLILCTTLASSSPPPPSFAKVKWEFNIFSLTFVCNSYLSPEPLF